MKFTEEEKSKILSDCQVVFDNFEYNEGRVPFTYHHDYLRQKLNSGYSRADIASRKADEVELNLFAARYIIDNSSPDVLFKNSSTETNRDSLYNIIIVSTEMLSELEKLEEKGEY